MSPITTSDIDKLTKQQQRAKRYVYLLVVVFSLILGSGITAALFEFNYQSAKKEALEKSTEQPTFKIQLTGRTDIVKGEIVDLVILKPSDVLLISKKNDKPSFVGNYENVTKDPIMAYIVIEKH